jgi:hypothetical protein
MYYSIERDENFFEACNAVRRKNPFQPVWWIARVASKTKAKSFYLHRREYASIIKNAQKGLLPKNALKKELYLEVWQAAEKLKELNPTITTTKLTEVLHDTEAPRFYLSPRRAADLYYKLLKNGPL